MGNTGEFVGAFENKKKQRNVKWRVDVSVTKHTMILGFGFGFLLDKDEVSSF